MALPARREKDSRMSGVPTHREFWNPSGTQPECHLASRSSESLRNAGCKLAELVLSYVVKDHPPVQRPGDEVGVDDRGVEGLEDARRPHGICSNEACSPVAQEKVRSLGSFEHLKACAFYARNAWHRRRGCELELKAEMDGFQSSPCKFLHPRADRDAMAAGAKAF